MEEARQFGRYRVTRSLGSGAMGEVYEAVDDVLGREVAIKTVKPVKGALGLDDRFKQEARAIAQLSHPGVVQLFDIDLASDPPYLVMERVAGPSLAAQLKDGALPAGELVPLGIQIARALAAAHAAGIVHRDVKPANVLAAGPGAWKLADFGVAHTPDSSLTFTGQFVGSPAYAAPEALVKGVSAPAGDVYGLGATLYEAATGSWPRRDAGGAVLAPVPPLADKAPHVPRAIAHAIDRAVAFEPDQRPSAAELAELLANPADSMPLPAAIVTPKPPIARWRLWTIGGAVLVLVIALASRGGGGGKSSGDEAAPAPAAPDDDRAPPIMDEHAARDWNRIVDEARKGHYRKARERLDDWERRYGETDESRQLKDQLPDDDEPAPPGPPGRGKHKHGD
ncbi:MAG: serine/threonine-protein kinase [Acidobacteriota bacterium]